MSEPAADGVLYGVYEATVTDIRDPEALGRVRVRLTSRKVAGFERSWPSRSAPGMLTVSAGMSRFSAMVGCDTLQANSVIAASYTPGAGNIW